MIPKEMTEFEKRICDYVSTYGGVTCVELANAFGDGNYEIWHPIHKNMLIAFRLSAELADALINLVDSTALVSVPCHPMIFMMDGCYPELPTNMDVKGNMDVKCWCPSRYHTYDTAIQLIESAFGDDPAYVAKVKNDIKNRKEMYEQMLREQRKN